MTEIDPHEVLAHIRARAEKASPGTWYDEKRNRDEPYSLTTVYYGFHNGETPDRNLVAEATYDNAQFIAAARTIVPALVNALEAVLAKCAEEEGAFASRLCRDHDGNPFPARVSTADIRAAIAEAMGGGSE